MFGLSQKERAARTVGKAARLAVSAEHLSPAAAMRLGLTREAAAYLVSDAAAHRIFVLGLIASEAHGREPWNTFQFFTESVQAGILEFEIAAGLAPNSLFTVIFRRYSEFVKMPQAEAAGGGRFRDTARRVQQLDPRANVANLSRLLEETTMAYVRSLEGF